MTQTAEPGRAAAPGPTRIVFGTDGWRARVADEFSFENVRRCADGVARVVVERGDQAKGVVIAYDRRFASEHFARAAAEVLLAHDIPVAISRTAVPTQMSSYEVVQRGRRGGHRDHGLAQPLDRQRVQGQVADRGGGGRGHAADDRGGDPRERRTGHRPAAARGRRGGGARRVVRPVRGLPGLRRPHAGPRRAPGRRRVRARRAAVRRGLGLDPAAARRRAHPGHGDPQRAQPVLRRHQPRADPAQRRRGAGDARGRRVRPRAPARRGRGPGRRGRRAGHVPPPAGGHQPAHVLPGRVPGDARPGRRVGEQHLDGREPRADLRGRDLRGPGRLQVHRAEDDRDGGDARGGGVGRVRVRDAPARARRHLRRPVPARPVPARARAGPHAGLAGDGGLPRARRAVVLSPDRRPLRSPLVRRREAAGPRRPPRVAADRRGRRAHRPDAVAGHRRRRQVVPRRRLVAARAGERDRAAGARLHGGDRPRPARRAWSSRASSWSAAGERGVGR